MAARPTPAATTATPSAPAAPTAATTARTARLRSHPEIVKVTEQQALLNAGLTAFGAPSPFYQPHEGVNGATVGMRLGRDEPARYVNFSSYNYLGLAGHPAVIAAAQEAVAAYGTSVSASRALAGEIPLHRELETRLAEAYGVGDAVVTGSGYLTNAALVGYILGPRDLAVCDSLVHNSVVTGTQIAGCKRLNFRHNDPDALDALLRRSRPHFERVLVIVEGVYSMDGDIVRLPEIIEVARRHDCLVMVDEAHSFGVLGERGLGVREHYGLDGGAVDLWMGTLSKSLASYGGFVAADAEVVQALKYAAPGLSIFAAGPPPGTMAAAITAFDLMLAEPQRVRRLQANGAAFLAAARDAGLRTASSGGTPIVPVLLDGSERTVRASVALLDEHINASPILYPSVAEDETRLRFFISADHTDEQLARTVEVLSDHVHGRGATAAGAA